MWHPDKTKKCYYFSCTGRVVRQRNVVVHCCVRNLTDKWYDLQNNTLIVMTAVSLCFWKQWLFFSFPWSLIVVLAPVLLSQSLHPVRWLPVHSAFLLQIAVHSTLPRCCSSLPLTLYCGVHCSSSVLFSLACFWCNSSTLAHHWNVLFNLNTLFPEETALLQGKLGLAPTVILHNLYYCNFIGGTGP